MILLLASIIIPFVTALVCLGNGTRPGVARVAGVAGAALLLLSSALLLKETLASGFIVIQVGKWAAPFGITLIADVFSASMVCIVRSARV